jgi:hypothetical protein
LDSDEELAKSSVSIWTCKVPASVGAFRFPQTSSLVAAKSTFSLR